MRIRELMKFTYDNVYLYIRVSDSEFKDLYKGKMENVPVRFWDCEIINFGAKRKDWLDIQIVYNE